ncbi:MAG: hypothetical protein JSV88_26575 [Candidatus Aminicenantes bacterium]|nr:MAG: hypothetical protein JSV88_26575 [Candidatus Aminicenantes bacterium]
MKKTRSTTREIKPYSKELGLRRIAIQLEQERTRHQRFSSTKLPFPDWTGYSSQRHIRDIAFDAHHHCIWLATWGGLLRWEPETDRITRYTSEHGLLGNATNRIAVDHKGIVWACGHGFGLFYLLPDKGANWQSIHQFNSWSILCLLPCPECGIYAALRDLDGRSVLGVLESPQADLKLLLKNNLANKDIDALVMDTEGVLWIGNAWGLHCYINPEKTLHYDLDGARVRSLAAGLDGTLWIGSNRGLYGFRKDKTPTHFQEKDWPGDEVFALTMNPGSADLWVVTSRETGKISNNRWQKIYDSQPNRLNVLLTTKNDDKSITWGGGANGLFKLGLPKLEKAFTWSQADALSNAVQCLEIDNDALWVGTARGLYHFQFESQDWTDYNAEIPGLFHDVRALLPIPSKHRVWVGSWSSGLRSLVHGYDLPDPLLPAVPIVSLAASENGILWAATIDMIYWKKPDTQTWEPVPGALPGQPPKTLNLGIIQVICPQMTGSGQGLSRTTLWIGTSNGLLRYRPDGPVNWDSPREWGAPSILEQDSIQALIVDLNNRLWIGTSHGLYCQRTWKCCRETDVRALACTSEGTLWVGTSTALEEWHLPKRTTKFSGEPKKHFTVNNSGMAANRVTDLALREIHSDCTREVWIGSPNGLSCYRYPISREK